MIMSGAALVVIASATRGIHKKGYIKYKVESKHTKEIEQAIILERIQ